MAAASSNPACASKIDIMKLREKIAMIWTFPMVFVLVMSFGLLSGILILIANVLTFSGTAGASIYLFDKIKLKVIDRRLRKLVREDEKLHKFDSSKLKKDENTTSIAD